MNKLNIATLFPSEDGTVPYIGGKLDVDTLFKTEGSNNNTKCDFDSKILLLNSQMRKEKLITQNINMYNVCCDRIKSASKLGITDIVFEVLNYIADCPDYKPYECLKYIREQLTSHKIHTHIISETKIFITWNKIESRLQNQ